MLFMAVLARLPSSSRFNQLCATTYSRRTNLGRAAETRIPNRTSVAEREYRSDVLPTGRVVK